MPLKGKCSAFKSICSSSEAPWFRCRAPASGSSQPPVTPDSRGLDTHSPVEVAHTILTLRKPHYIFFLKREVTIILKSDSFTESPDTLLRYFVLTAKHGSHIHSSNSFQLCEISLSAITGDHLLSGTTRECRETAV